MTQPRVSAEAQYLLDHPILKRAFEEIERASMEAAISAPMDADRTRADLMAEVRAIRSVRRKLGHIAKGHVTPPNDTEA